jgi:hypothetical protein
LFFASGGPFKETLARLDSSDSRVLSVTYVGGQLWGALGTALTVAGENRAGIAWFVLNPRRGRLINEGRIGLENNHLTYPAVAVTQDGFGVIGFTLVGEDHFPSAAYTTVDDRRGTGPIRIAAGGLGPHDGFTAYKAFVGDPPRTRWGDYGAAVAVGDSVWVASEYIAQTCTLAQFLAGSIGSCGDTRSSLGNWATRISRIEED